jgi:hypothetical protein
MSRLTIDGCYKTKARIFRDDPREVDLRWFLVPDGTPFLPCPTLWAGRPYRYEKTPPTEGPGELTQSRLKWDKGLPPAVPSAWIGSNDWFSNGVPISALGGPPPQVRPGVCTPVNQESCATGCDQAPLISAVWEMDYFPPIGPLTSQVLVKTEGCTFSSNCYLDCPVCPNGTAAAWFVDLVEPIPCFSSSVLTPIAPCAFSSCCASPFLEF